MLRFSMALALALGLAGHAHAQSPVTSFMPKGAFATTGSTASLGATSATVLAADLRRTMLLIQLNTAGASVACNPGGTAVLNTAGSVTITGQGSYMNFAAIGGVPTNAINCIASGASTSITVWSLSN